MPARQVSYSGLSTRLFAALIFCALFAVACPPRPALGQSESSSEINSAPATDSSPATDSQSASGSQSASDSRSAVFVARIDDDAITPVTAGFIERAIAEAASSDAAALVIELDTPGGLMESTRQIVKAILASPVPVVVYVTPSGARAASAGVFITMAAHVAAMAPATHIGAAHPVNLGGSPGLPAESDTTGTAAQQSVMEEKVVNDARAWARALATLRGRNADWAEAAVSESQSVSAAEALDLNVIDLIAPNLTELLVLIDNSEVDLAGDTSELQTSGATVRTVEMRWGERVLSVLSNPNLAFFLMMFGFYGILFEFYSPGWGISGTLGAICLVLAFFGLAVLPINYAGLILIVLAIGLFVAEAFFTSFGMLTVGGAVCLILGAIMLVDTPMPVLRVSVWVVVPFAVASGILAFFLGGRVVKSLKARVRTGAEGMIGEHGSVDQQFESRQHLFVGTVSVHGELWRAKSAAPLAEGESVRVVSQQDLTLTVERVRADDRREA